MNTNKKIIAFVLALVIAGAIYGAYQYPKQEQTAGTSPTTSTFNSAKMAAIVFAPATASATSTSILNSDSNDRYIMSNFATCGSVGTSKTPLTGTGLDTLVFKMATTSTAAPAVISNTNLIGIGIIATATPDLITAATSTGVGSSFLTRWASGSYLTVWANATNTAVCTVGVNYVPS